MGKNEKSISKLATLAAKALSGWRLPTVRDAVTLAAYVFTRTPANKQSE